VNHGLELVLNLNYPITKLPTYPFLNCVTGSSEAVTMVRP
jgi:hypothetical protein